MEGRIMNVSPYSISSGPDISRIEDFLVAMLWKPEMWALFSDATGKHCHETPNDVQSVWAFRTEGKAKQLASYIAEALDGENFSVWVEPVSESQEFCAVLSLRAQILEPVA